MQEDNINSLFCAFKKGMIFVYEKEIGKKLQELRKRKNITQESLAEKIGLTSGHISAIERGVNAPSLDTLIMYMNAVECSADDLFSGVLENGYKTRSSFVAEKLEKLPAAERTKILNVLEVMLQNTEIR